MRGRHDAEGAEVTVTGRNRDSLPDRFGHGYRDGPHGTADISDYDIIANATPIGMYAEESTGGRKTSVGAPYRVRYGLRRQNRLIDAAESKKCRIVSGEDMLAQGPVPSSCGPERRDVQGNEG